jgi:hypothetical protein
LGGPFWKRPQKLDPVGGFFSFCVFIFYFFTFAELFLKALFAELLGKGLYALATAGTALT